MRKKNSPTDYREQLKEKILNVAIEEFYANGVKLVKMDDIARKLVISKRTLYEIYSNKEDLLFAAVKHTECYYSCQMKEYENDSKRNVIEVIMKFYQMQMQKFSKVNPLFFVELHKYKEIIDYLHGLRDDNHKLSKVFFSKGVKEGYFRSDIDYELIEKIGSASIDFVMQNKLYEKYSMQHMFQNIILLYIRGFCTPKGIELIEKILKGNI